MIRCPWAVHTPLEQSYHDEEWGVPLRDDQKLFEFLILEGAQAGLSWRTILQKRAGYRRAFADFDAKTVAGFSLEDAERLRQDPSIVRNRLKIAATISNAQAFLNVQDEYSSFSDYIWEFVDNKPFQNHWQLQQDVPAVSKEAEVMSKDLKKRGFRFVGPTICYAFMQAVGMVNDHIVSCYRHKVLILV